MDAIKKISRWSLKTHQNNLKCGVPKKEKYSDRERVRAYGSTEKVNREREAKKRGRHMSTEKWEAAATGGQNSESADFNILQQQQLHSVTNIITNNFKVKRILLYP